MLITSKNKRHNMLFISKNKKHNMLIISTNKKHNMLIISKNIWSISLIKKRTRKIKFINDAENSLIMDFINQGKKSFFKKDQCSHYLLKRNH